MDRQRWKAQYVHTGKGRGNPPQTPTWSIEGVKSIVFCKIQAGVNADCLFVYFAMGFKGPQHDSTILRMSSLGTFIRSLAATSWLVAADVAYKLSKNLVTPFRGSPTTMPRPLRAFNKAHSRARIAVERAFGILKMRWRCLFKVCVSSVTFALLRAKLPHPVTDRGIQACG